MFGNQLRARLLSDRGIPRHTYSGKQLCADARRGLYHEMSHSGMGKAISVRLDDEAGRALQTIESTGLTRSEAIRSSLLSSAARLRRGRDLAAEAAALEADETDRSTRIGG